MKYLNLYGILNKSEEISGSNLPMFFRPNYYKNYNAPLTFYHSFSSYAADNDKLQGRSQA